MKKEEKDLSSQIGDQEELSNLEFGFVYDFFISEQVSSIRKQESSKEKPQQVMKDKFKYNDQSLTFFLPDFFTDEG